MHFRNFDPTDPRVDPTRVHPWYASPYLWNQLSSSLRQPHSVHCPPGSPHPAVISPHHSHHLRSHHLSLFRPFTPDLKLISFTNPFLHSHSFSFQTDAFTDLNLYWIKWTLLCLFQFLATCARLSWILSFRVHVKLFYRIVLLLSVHLYSALSLQIPNALHALCQYLANRKHLSEHLK